MDDDDKPLLYPSLYEDCARNHFNASDAASRRPFHVEPSYVNDGPQRVTSEASAMNKRIHYYGKLSAPSERSLVAPDHVIPAPEEIYVYSPLGTALKIGTDCVEKNSSIVTIFMIWNTMMGTSILSIPWGIKQAGFTTGVCLLLLMGLLTLYCCYRVVKSRGSIPSLDTSSWEFPDVCQYYFGSFGQWSSLLFSMVSLVGAMIVYWVLMSNFLFNTGKCIYSTVSVVYLLSLVTYKAARQGFHLHFQWKGVSDFFVPEFRTSFPQLTGILTLAFFIHNCVITLLKSNKKPENNVRDLSIAYLLVGVTYVYVGIMVFASFPSPPLAKECIQQNFLDNFPSSDILAFVARIFLLFQMMTVYPLLGYLVRVQLLGHLFGKPYPSVFHVLALNIAVVGVGVIMARFYPNIGIIIRFSGAACGLAFVFVYPSLIHMISLHRNKQLKMPSAIFHTFVIILGLGNLGAQFIM
uniref:Neutral amino acid transporter 9 n=1 Tax=Leptobrachium leishanense TaxID=445787 RepID=A0A8C5M9H0_9ANUR